MVALGRDAETENPLQVILKVERHCPLDVLPSKFNYPTYENILTAKLKRLGFLSHGILAYNCCSCNAKLTNHLLRPQPGDPP
jgi:hypothetical protein